MRHRGALLTVAVLVLAVAPARAQNPLLEPTGFHLLGPGGSATPGSESYLCPNEIPPFLHWDLRQFPGCVLPFQVNGNIPAPGNPTAAQALTAVDIAANTWTAVTPTPVTLLENNAGAPLCSQAPALDGHNCVSWDPAFPYAANIYAVTLIWRTVSSGVILESDVTLNPTPDGNKVWQGSPPDCASAAIGIEAVALHEFGHFLGLGHPDIFTSATGCANDDPTGSTVMYSFYANACKTALLQPDKDGVNYLYTPDLGDLADPPYPTKVHTGVPSGTVLSGVKLETPGNGPEHLFGIYQDPTVGNLPRYQYEWLAFKNGAIDDSSLECEARKIDSFDDGVSASCECEDGVIDGPIALTLHVKTAADVRGRSHTYNAGSAMYLNGWFDWNGDGDFLDANEHPIGAGAGVAVYDHGAFTFLVTPPPGTPCTTRSRFRLDWREDVGQLLKVDPTLNLATGAAQQGEVEDYTGVCGVDGTPGGGGPGGRGIPRLHPPNQYCHPMGKIAVTFPGLGTISILDLCHPPAPIPIGTATATTFPAAGQDCMQTSLCFKVDGNNDGVIDEDLCLTGPVCVNRSAPYVDPDDGLRTIDTEMVSLNMTGYSHFAGQVTIRLAPGTHSLGQIKQTQAAADTGVDVSLATPATSFFNVNWVVDSGLLGTSEAVGPTRVDANISSVPPGETISDSDSEDATEPTSPP
jgi:hypothetical protein